MGNESCHLGTCFFSKIFQFWEFLDRLHIQSFGLWRLFLTVYFFILFSCLVMFIYMLNIFLTFYRATINSSSFLAKSLSTPLDVLMQIVTVFQVLLEFEENDSMIVRC